MKHNKLKYIQDLGQSIWLDFFDRKIMDSGELKRLIEQDGISGVTANPSIFERAINSSSDYEDDVMVFSKQDRNDEETFLRIAVKDLKRAADLLKPVYDKTSGNDGFVSIEVSPYLAHDTEGTIRQARELWQAINRVNIMIKIPGTTEGLAAIRKCTGEGININVTLLFGLPRYRQVAGAYIAGLEDRIKNNESVDQIASAASFFLSRIDVMIDPLLKEKGLNEMKGKLAISSARKAYEIYKEVFHSEQFKKLEARGARRQRLLWASTGSKDPSFSDVKYVEALIGAETINTIDIQTMQAFNDHGKAEIHLEDSFDTATKLLARVKENGIDMNIITQKLEDEGIEKFRRSYDKILGAIENQKRQVIY